LSEYFETGLAKLKTHGYEDERLLNCSRDEAMKHCTDLYRRASTRLANLELDIAKLSLEVTIGPHGSDKPLGTAFKNFHEDLSAGLKKKRTPKLSRDRKALEMTEFYLGQSWPSKKILQDGQDPNTLQCRLFGICPCCLLKPFFEKYQEEINQKPQYRGLGEFKHFIWPRMNRRYLSPYHGVLQFPTYLVDHRLFLPYTIANVELWTKKSELLNCWSRIGEPIGSLFTYSAPQREEPAVARLLLTHSVESEVTRELVSAPSVAEECGGVDSQALGSYLILEFQHWWMNDEPSMS
jgi:hypothetical protein